MSSEIMLGSPIWGLTKSGNHDTNIISVNTMCTSLIIKIGMCAMIYSTVAQTLFSVIQLW